MRNGVSCVLGTSSNTTCFLFLFLRHSENFVRYWQLRPYFIASYFSRWRGIFEGFLQDGGRAEFALNLCASPFNKDLSNDNRY
jgi:hypothetical protein